jgi:DNA-binding transcriptional MerR regulator
MSTKPPNEELFPWESEPPADGPAAPSPDQPPSSATAASPAPGQDTGGSADAVAKAETAAAAHPADASSAVQADASDAGAAADADTAAQAGEATDAGGLADADEADEIFEAARARADRAFAPLPGPAETLSGATAAPRADRRIAPREYYSISEVCEITGLKQHVLRYWESQFPLLNPSKNRSGNRVYQRKEIRLILLVKKLLYEEKYTVEGAKAKLEQLRGGGELAEATSHALDRHMLQVLRSELRQLAVLLTPPQPS